MTSGANLTQAETAPPLDLRLQYREIEGEIAAALAEVCRDQQFILGPRVRALEERIAAYSQCRYGVGVSSGTDALLVALMALGVESGDEVVTTPFTFFAAGGVIARLGARPVFCDIDPASFNLSPAAVADVLAGQCERRNGRLVNRTTGRPVKALVPVQLSGLMADMDPLLELARRHGLAVVEDAAQAIGAEYAGGRRAGSMGDIGCFSFFSTKSLGAFGDAGRNDLPESVRAAGEVLVLPVYQEITDAQRRHVMQSIVGFYRDSRHAG